MAHPSLPSRSGTAGPGRRMALPTELFKQILLHQREDLEKEDGDWETPLRSCMSVNKLPQQVAIETFFVEFDFGPHSQGAWAENRVTLSRVAGNSIFAARVRIVKLSLQGLFDPRRHNHLGLPHLSYELTSLVDDLKMLTCLREVHIDLVIASESSQRFGRQRARFWRTVLAGLGEKALHLYLHGELDVILGILSRSEPLVTSPEAFFGRLRTLSVSGNHLPARGTAASGTLLTIELRKWVDMPKLERLYLDCSTGQTSTPVSLKIEPDSLKSLQQLSIQRCSVSMQEVDDLLEFDRSHFQEIALMGVDLHRGTWAEILQQLVTHPHLRGVFLRELAYDKDWNLQQLCRETAEPIILESEKAERALVTPFPGDIVSLADLIKHQYGRNGNYLSHKWSPSRYAKNGGNRHSGKAMYIWHQIVPEPQAFDNLPTVEDDERRKRELGVRYDDMKEASMIRENTPESGSGGNCVF